MSTDQDDPFSSKPSRSQPYTGLPSDGTRTPDEATEPSGAGPHAEPPSAPGRTPPPAGASGTTSGTDARPGRPPATGSGTTYPVGSPVTSETPGAAPPPVTPTPPSYGGGTPYDTPAAPPVGGPDSAEPSAHGAGAAAAGATPPPGGSPYDTPAAPPGGGYAAPGAAYGAADPRLAGMPPLAGLGRRLLARVIDGLIIWIPVSILSAVFSRDALYDTGGATFGWTLLGMAVYLVYEGMLLTRGGQTVGKKLMGIRVAMLDNGAVPAGGPGWFRAAVYSLPQLVPCIGTLFWLYNVLSCTWDKPFHQAVHDKAAKTVVVSAQDQRFTA